MPLQKQRVHLCQNEWGKALQIMIKVSDYIAQTLVRHGIEHIFLVTGGGAMPAGPHSGSFNTSTG